MKKKTRLKQTCDGCRAYDYVNNVDRKCSLGYAEDYGKPLEICPKPKTIKQLIEAGKLRL